MIDVERIKKRYPKGTRIRLKRRMNDPYTPIPRGTQSLTDGSQVKGAYEYVNGSY